MTQRLLTHDQMGQWAKNGIFKYGGRQSSGMPLFYTQECAMTIGSSKSLSGILESMKGIEVMSPNLL